VKLAADVVDMRRRMHAAHPNRSAQFDLKHDPGGMVDVEFSVQYLVLAHSRMHPSLTRNAGNIALLALAADVGLVARHLAVEAADAYRAYRRLQHQVRLQGAREARVEPSGQAQRRRAVEDLWSAVFGHSWAEGGTGNAIK
jgi:glutamate-ammonia-ligase adenylyltransferase